VADVKRFRAFKSFDDCTQLQLDIDSIHDWWTANFMTVSISQNRVITTSRNSNTLFCKHKLGDFSITRTTFIKDLRILIDFKLYVSCHVYYTFSTPVRFCISFV
jgi:hypothetical protein